MNYPHPEAGGEGLNPRFMQALVDHTAFAGDGERIIEVLQTIRPETTADHAVVSFTTGPEKREGRRDDIIVPLSPDETLFVLAQVSPDQADAYLLHRDRRDIDILTYALNGVGATTPVVAGARQDRSGSDMGLRINTVQWVKIMKFPPPMRHVNDIWSPDILRGLTPRQIQEMSLPARTIDAIRQYHDEHAEGVA